MIIHMIFSNCNLPRNEATERKAEFEYILVICKYSLIDNHSNAVKWVNIISEILQKYMMEIIFLKDNEEKSIKTHIGSPDPLDVICRVEGNKL